MALTMMSEMDPLGGVTTLAASILLGLAAAFPLRERMSSWLVDTLLAISGAGMAVGGLLLLEDVSGVAWLVTPPVLAALTVIHVRALFAGSGPLRT